MKIIDDSENTRLQFPIHGNGSIETVKWVLIGSGYKGLSNCFRVSTQHKQKITITYHCIDLSAMAEELSEDILKNQEDYADGFPIFNVPKCKCGMEARVMVSWTVKNPGRRFFRCAKPKVYGEAKPCPFFRWYDEEYAPHIKHMLYTMKKSNEELHKEGEKLRGDVFELKYLIDKASIIDAISMEDELIKASDKIEKMEVELTDVYSSNRGLQMEIRELKNELNGRRIREGNRGTEG
ncbi:uncharacterized protein LOC126675365 [Mercurialis annua]|uniref:uncharacterized protein LOC126675365 n=1 Tax=Mercurialis annua TaxID=3986 RepID=UPI00215F20EB|nr:uncharacterized protein LOC126675365 [Mercurialis annua]